MIDPQLHQKIAARLSLVSPAIPVGIWQGLLTVLAFFLGTVMSGAAIAAPTATGGGLLLGVGQRLQADARGAPPFI